MRRQMNERHPRQLDYAVRRSRSSSTIDGMEIALWVIWALILTIFVLLIVF